MGAVDPSDPQSLNQYGYVGNRPLNHVDPLGLDDGDWCEWGGGFDVSISFGSGGVIWGGCQLSQLYGRAVRCYEELDLAAPPRRSL
jgi:hypothetical protein